MLDKFSLAKRMVGAYFNDGEGISSVQCRDHSNVDPRLIEAVRAAHKEFFRVFNKKRPSKNAQE